LEHCPRTISNDGKSEGLVEGEWAIAGRGDMKEDLFTPKFPESKHQFLEKILATIQL